MRLKIALSCAAILGGVAAIAAGASAQTKLPDYPGKDWPIYSGSYNSQRYSTLTQITPANAKRVQARWNYRMAGFDQLEGTPVVADGVMYVSGFNRVDALDARTGNLIWKFQRLPAVTTFQRGVAVMNNRVYVPTTDGHIVALDARTGAQVWESKGGPQLDFSGTAPLLANGKIIVTGNRPGGFIAVYSQDTGDFQWVWNALPKEGDPEYASWGGGKPQGAPIWIGGTYDPQTNLIYYGTGQPNPQWAGASRTGSDLYSDSIVALDLATGKMKWFYQATPHDTHDYDTTEMIVAADILFKGKPRKVVMQANRNGYFYILDRVTGEFLRATPFVSKVNWGTVDPVTGKATTDPSRDPSVKGTDVCPTTAGATNWPAPSYNPVTKFLYVPTVEGCGLDYLASTSPVSETNYQESKEESERWQLYTRALDVTTGKTAWDYQQVRSNHYGPGIVSTAGGVVFSPEQYGQTTLLNAKTGQLLWHFNTGNVITASPITYSVKGQQFFAVESGSNVFAFALPDPAPLPETKP